MLDLEPERSTFIVLTCEHAGNVVPPGYEDFFLGHQDILESHRAYDLGAFDVALKLASRLATPLQFTEITRLLVDTNRSEHNEQVFSDFIKPISASQRESILCHFYRPHRTSVARMVSALIHSGHMVLHLAVHSFVDVLEGQPRELDIGLLFDPQREREAMIAAHWLEQISSHRARLRCAGNQPYLGTDDGLTTAMRQRFDADKYVGIEVEIRQGLLKSRVAQNQMAGIIAESLQFASSATVLGL